MVIAAVTVVGWEFAALMAAASTGSTLSSGPERASKKRSADWAPLAINMLISSWFKTKLIAMCTRAGLLRLDSESTAT